MIYDTSKTISSKQWGEIVYDGTFLFLSTFIFYDTFNETPKLCENNKMEKLSWENAGKGVSDLEARLDYAYNHARRSDFFCFPAQSA